MARTLATSALSALIAAAVLEPAQTQDRLELRLGRSVLRVDASSGRDLEAFGSFSGGAIMPTGIAAVTDRIQRRVVLLHPPPVTSAVTTVGRSGRGPGEFLEPTRLHYRDSVTLVLLDRANGRLAYYQVEASTLRFLRTEPAPELPEDFCYLGEQLVTLHYDPTRRVILRWASLSIHPARFGGEPFVRGSPLVEAATTKGQLLCAADRGLVVVASFTTGELRAYLASGQEVWRTVFPEFIPMRARESAGGFAYEGELRNGESRNHLTATLLRADANHLLVQFGLTILGKNRIGDLSFATVESRLIRLSDGHVVGRQTTLPILLAADYGLALAAGGVPDLWVEIRPFTIGK